MSEMVRIKPEEAVQIVRAECPKAIQSLNNFSLERLRTRKGRLGSGMGALLEALWGFHMNVALNNEGGSAQDCEIGWFEKNQQNDFVCLLRETRWNIDTQAGELFRIEAKSMNADEKVEEQKGHFDEIQSKIGPYDQLLLLIWKWVSVDDWREYPKVLDWLICSAQSVSELRDALHIARGGSFIELSNCPDKDIPCKHIGEPLNSSNKRERTSGPATAKPKNVSAANNFGGILRLLHTSGEKARRVFRNQRASDPAAHEYISFIYRNFPNQEINQYVINEWKKVGLTVGLDIKNKTKEQLVDELRQKPNYQELLRDVLKPD